MAECCTVTLASGPDQDVDRPADYLLSSRILHRHDHADAGRLRFSERPSVHRERGANQDGFGTVTDVMPVVHTTGAPGGHRGGGGLSAYRLVVLDVTLTERGRGRYVAVD